MFGWSEILYLENIKSSLFYLFTLLFIFNRSGFDAEVKKYCI